MVLGYSCGAFAIIDAIEIHINHFKSVLSSR